MKRIVIIPVEDDEVESITYHGHARHTLTSGEVVPWTTSSWHVPVPSDDRLTRDVHLLTEPYLTFAAGGDSLGYKNEAAKRLRAAFHLDNDV